MAGLPCNNRFTTAAVLPAFFTLIVGAIFGGSMVFVTPPFDVPEENQHFLRSYQCSEGIVWASRNGDTPGRDLPASLCEVSSAIHNAAKDEYGLEISCEKIKKVLSIPLDRSKTRFSAYPVGARYGPSTYLGSAVAIRIGRRAGATALQELYIGRIGTLTVYLLLVVAAVWLVPLHKWLMSLLALMPMSIFTAASISPDGLTIGYSLLAIAMILRLALQADRVYRCDLGWLGAILLLVGLAKPGYAVIALLFLIVPKEKFSGRGECWLARALMIGLPVAAGLAWAYSVREICVLPLRPCVDTHAQALWIVAHPWHFMRLVISRITNGWLNWGVVGTLGWGTIWLVPQVYYVYWTALITAAALDGGANEVRLPRYARVISLGVYLSTMTVLCTLTYLTWHAVGEGIIHGVQSRYFVPILPLLLLPLRASAKVASSRFSRWLVPAVAIAAVLFGVAATWQAFIARYYWH
jgi:uncharacterized membrane protein